jgi:hypothetical protein
MSDRELKFPGFSNGFDRYPQTATAELSMSPEWRPTCLADPYTR